MQFIINNIIYFPDPFNTCLKSHKMICTNKKLLVFVIVPITVLGFTLTAIHIVGLDSNFYVVVSDSMIPSLHTGHVVITNTNNNDTCSSFECLKVGDVIVFHPNSPTKNSETDKIIVHRIEEIGFDSDGQRVLRTKGDANPQSIQGVDYPISKDNYVGKVVHVIPYAGLLLMYLDLLARVVMQPLLYIIIAAIVIAIFLVEYYKKKPLKTKKRNRRSKDTKFYKEA
jgi:signal peptidase I